MTDGAMREAVRADILRAFGLKPYEVGLAPVPRRVRLWWKLTAPFKRRWYKITGQW